ncbi:MAG: hypothetical protein DVB29_00355 [Verrucomicrobia bacterium]|nr:MAG: hypothetical protein DVB29_00355 [Verrucomicrobiota bacterium]
MNNRPISGTSGSNLNSQGLSASHPQPPQQGHLAAVPVVHVIPGDDNDGFHTPPPTVRDPNRECTPPRPRYGEARWTRSENEKATQGTKINVVETEEPNFMKTNFGKPPPPPPSGPSIGVH